MAHSNSTPPYQVNKSTPHIHNSTCPLSALPSMPQSHEIPHTCSCNLPSCGRRPKPKLQEMPHHITFVYNSSWHNGHLSTHHIIPSHTISNYKLPFLFPSSLANSTSNSALNFPANTSASSSFSSLLCPRPNIVKDLLRSSGVSAGRGMTWKCTWGTTWDAAAPVLILHQPLSPVFPSLSPPSFSLE
jgi:hypothetical protein